MEHGERNGCGELPILERHGGCVAFHDIYIGILHSVPERLRQSGINFNRSEMRDPCAQYIRGQSGTGAHFQDILP